MKIGKNLNVNSFLEKPNLNSGWINGGFFVLNKDIFNYIKIHKQFFEKEPLVSITKKNN